MRKNSLPKRKKNNRSKWIIIILSVVLVALAVTIGVLVQTDRTGRINKFISPQAAYALIEENQDNPNFVIIDDRYTNVFDSGHIGNATNIPWEAGGVGFADAVGKLDKDKVYLVYCQTGCGGTSRAMKELGFKEVYEIAGGFNAWSTEGLPIRS